jgi:hypothetical protein
MVNKKRRTRIENLSTIGKELSEEHLRLAAGGAADCSTYCRSNGGYVDWNYDCGPCLTVTTGAG